MGVLQPWEWGGDLGSKVWMWGQLVSRPWPSCSTCCPCSAGSCLGWAVWRTSALFPTLLALPAQLDQLHSLQGPVNFLGLVCFPTPMGSWSSQLLPAPLHRTGPSATTAQVKEELQVQLCTPCPVDQPTEDPTLQRGFCTQPLSRESSPAQTRLRGCAAPSPSPSSSEPDPVPTPI